MGFKKEPVRRHEVHRPSDIQFSVEEIGSARTMRGAGQIIRNDMRTNPPDKHTKVHYTAGPPSLRARLGRLGL